MRHQVHCSTVRNFHLIVSPPPIEHRQVRPFPSEVRFPSCCRGSEVGSEPPVDGSRFAQLKGMLKFLGAYALAKLLGFGLLGAIVIYLLIR
jgi:hypothetical protein